MKRTELQRGEPLERKSELKSNSTLKRTASSKSRRSTLASGRGFAASPEQREKVRGMACANCGTMGDEYTAIDPAHLCARGKGGCDHPDCVIPLCRMYGVAGCHRAFDAGEIDLLPMLEPAFRREVAHAVLHLGLEGVRMRLSPSLYRGDRAA